MPVKYKSILIIIFGNGIYRSNYSFNHFLTTVNTTFVSEW